MSEGEAPTATPLGGETPRIVLLIAHAENRRRLATWLREQSPYQPISVTDAETDMVGDLCLVDPGALESNPERIRDWKDAANGRFHPVLLAHATDELPTSETIWELIDETISTPVNLAELRRRLENLLERQTLSRDLAVDLEASEARYEAVFRAVNDAILVIDPTRDQILECNPRSTDLLGYSRTELKSLSPCDDLHPQDPAAFNAFLDAVQECGQLTGELLECERKDGDSVQAEVSAGVVDAHETPRVILSIRDVTQRREHERQLERQRNRLDELNRITKTLHGTVRAVVHATTREDLEREVCRRLSESDVYQFAWIGAREDQQIRPRAAGESAQPYLNHLDITPIQPSSNGPTASALRTQSVHAVRDVSNDSHVRPWEEELGDLDVNATAAVPILDGERVFGALNLYTTRQNAFDEEEQTILEDLGRTIGREITGIEAREEAEFFQEAVEHAGSAISILGTDGTVEYVNESFETITGYPRTTIRGNSFSRILDDESEINIGRIQNAVLHGVVSDREMQIRMQNGQRRYMEQTVAPIYGPSGDVEHHSSLAKTHTSVV